MASTHRFGLALPRFSGRQLSSGAGPDTRVRHGVGRPNQGRASPAGGSELGVRARPPWPLELLAFRQRLSLERTVVGLTLPKHVVHDPSQLLGDHGACDRLRLSAQLRLIESS